MIEQIYYNFSRQHFTPVKFMVEYIISCVVLKSRENPEVVLWTNYTTVIYTCFFFPFLDNTGASDNEGHEHMETNSHASGNISHMVNECFL